MTHYPNHVAIVSHRVQGSPMCHLMSFKPSEAPLGNAIRDFFVNSVARNDVPLAPNRQEPSSPAQPPAPSPRLPPSSPASTRFDADASLIPLPQC